MKIRNILWGVSAGIAMSACTDDVMEMGSGQPTFPGDKAYMMVNIRDVGSLRSRADNGGFMPGSENEYKVKDAHFYFYDDEGEFVTEADVWEGGEAVTPSGSNIDFKGKNVVVLKGLTHKNYPNYVVTVLNKPSDFTTPRTLAEMEKSLASASGVGIWNNDNCFTMSTTSYDAGKGPSSYYFATKVSEDNFSVEPIDKDSPSHPVIIHVERLAAKVALNLDLSPGVELSDGTTGYPLQQNITSDDGTALDKEVYVRFDGWKLNAVARHSYIVKNIDADWNPGFAWNDPGKFRSYWGMSFNYGKGLGRAYPSTSDGKTDASETNPNKTDYLSSYLKYTSLSKVNDFGLVAYCAENTNTVQDSINGIISNKNSSAITSILVKATICDKEGKGMDLVRYDGMLYTASHYLNYALKYLQDEGKLNVWYKKEDNSYAQIDNKYVALANAVDGKVKIVFKNDDPNTTFYSKDEAGQFTEITDVSGVDEILNEFNKNNSSDANGYKDGAMYYNIPIEHLRQSSDDRIREGDYGIVRNHYYQVTIKSLENLGRGIFDPTEVIVPQIDGDTYYIGAQINVLSWKLVSQIVEL